MKLNEILEALDDDNYSLKLPPMETDHQKMIKGTKKAVENKTIIFFIGDIGFRIKVKADVRFNIMHHRISEKTKKEEYEIHVSALIKLMTPMQEGHMVIYTEEEYSTIYKRLTKIIEDEYEVW